MKLTILEFKQKYPKLIKSFEKETGCNAIWNNKITGQFKFWLHRKIKNKDVNNRHYNYGKHHTEETKQKIRDRLKNRHGKQGEHHPCLTEDAKYKAIHMWANRYKPRTKKCDICGLPEAYDTNHGRLELSDITGLCLRDIDNFQWAHKSCHIQYDDNNNIIHEALISENLIFV